MSSAPSITSEPQHTWQGQLRALRGHPIVRIASWLLTILIWVRAGSRWLSLDTVLRSSPTLGYDLHFSWLAEQQFIRGKNPYGVPGFLYPPSHLLLALPFAFVSFHTVQQLFLPITLACMVATVAVAAWTLGRLPWGLTAALGAYLLTYTVAAIDEANLENVSAEIALGFAIILLLATRGHWTAAGVILGLTFALKPMLIPIPIAFIVTRQWRGLALSLGIPAVLSLIVVAIIPQGFAGFLAAIPSVLHRSGGYTAFNSTVNSVATMLGWALGLAIALRVVAFIITVLAARSARRCIHDPRVRLVTGTSSLLLGMYLFGPVSQDHYMLTLIPLAVGISSRASPMRWPTAWLGFAWLMGVALIPAHALGLGRIEALSVNRSLGMALVLCTVVIALRLEQLVGYLRDKRHRRPTSVLSPHAEVG